MLKFEKPFYSLKCKIKKVKIVRVQDRFRRFFLESFFIGALAFMKQKGFYFQQAYLSNTLRLSSLRGLALQKCNPSLASCPLCN